MSDINRKRVIIMKFKYLTLFAIILFSLLIPSVSSTEFDLTVKHMPYEGNTDTPIVILVTTTPLWGAKPWYIYVFWDGIPIMDGVADVKLADNSYEHRWRFTVYPPKDSARKGSHSVLIWVYDHEGTVRDGTFFYNIKGVVPRLEWWETLPQEFVDSLKGAKGDKGDKGDSVIGPIGPQGARGQKGDAGESIAGPQGPSGESIVGPRGDVGPKGEQGDQGSTGKSYPQMVFNAGLALSIIAVFVSVITANRLRK